MLEKKGRINEGIEVQKIEEFLYSRDIFGNFDICSILRKFSEKGWRVVEGVWGVAECYTEREHCFPLASHLPFSFSYIINYLNWTTIARVLDRNCQRSRDALTQGKMAVGR